jgi:formylglycine-generating enzyme required for sulfatase activity
MPQAFISYSRVDSAFVERFMKRLQMAFPHLTLWHDQSPHALMGGDNWWDAILKAIADSDIFIYILPNKSINSLYCQAEFTEARRLQKRIMTIQKRDKTDLTDDLDDIQFIDMKNGPDDPDALPRLYAAVNKQLSLTKKMRPLWKPATPKPRKDPPPSRSTDSPDITTPMLAKPTAEQEALRLAKSGVQWQIVGVIAIVMSLIPLLDRRSLEDVATEVAILRLNTTVTEIVLQVTVNALQTRNTILLDTLVTSTHVVTLVSSNTPTPTPLELAMQRARTGVSSNAEWEQFYPDGFTQDFDGVTMMLVPAGCFMMGTSENEIERLTEEYGDYFSNEGPQHEQCFDEPFWIDQTEVTQAQFADFGGVKTEVTQAQFADFGEAKVEANAFDGDQRPVERITWLEARDFCEKRGARLPTEREWEYAARGPNNWIYPWGNEWNEDNAVWSENSNDQTAEVGTRPAGASWVGALDMSGNVWEWTSTIYGIDNDDYDFSDSGDRLFSYPYVATDGREENSNVRTYGRVRRGGSWGNDSDLLRGAEHNGSQADYWDNYSGFRCALSS